MTSSLLVLVLIVVERVRSPTHHIHLLRGWEGWNDPLGSYLAIIPIANISHHASIYKLMVGQRSCIEAEGGEKVRLPPKRASFEKDERSLEPCMYVHGHAIPNTPIYLHRDLSVT